MRRPRVRFTVRRLMGLVVTVALLLAALRAVVIYLPHARQCWKLAAREEQLSRAYRAAAARYRSCVQAVPCSASEYCFNACLPHASAPAAGQPAASDRDRALAAAAHRRAAEDHERAARLRDARARRYHQAASRFSEPLPSWSPGEEAAANVFMRYQCDVD